ncbi:RNA polymerase sigma-70 factor [Pedobacter ginsenosidimutans]|nr:RNA polymerase sigma-70 factor [Pedobacter ginsenosidimutans]
MAFTEVFNRYGSLMYSHALNKLRNELDARDVVQEMFIRIWEKRDSIELKTNLGSYLFIVLRNSILNLIKHQSVVKNYSIVFSKTNEDSGIYTDTLIREKQLLAMIELEISNLPPRMRAVFELRRKEYLSNREVADRLGITESTAADQMKKALRILRNKLGLLPILLFYLNSK